jgi:outer membrane protein TolC
MLKEREVCVVLRRNTNKHERDFKAMQKKILRNIFIISILNVVSIKSWAQLTDYNQIVQPVEIKAKDFAEYLVQLAWLNGAAGKIAETKVLNAADNAKNVRKEWTKDIQVSFNLNEANLRPNTGGTIDYPASIDSIFKERNYTPPSLPNNNFFPRYNIGINLNVYNVLSQKTKNKISQREVTLAGYEVQEAMIATRAETLTRYVKYKLTKEILKTRAQMEQEANSAFILVQQLYKTDEKTFEEYSKASTALFQTKEARLGAETEVILAKLALEEIIGVRWELVQHPGKEE